MVQVTSLGFPNKYLKRIYEFFMYPAYLYMLGIGLLLGGIIENKSIKDEDVVDGDEDS